MVAATMKHMASNFAKLDKFEGVDFRRWQKKMHFLLSSMSVVYVLTTPIPDDGDDATVDQLRKRANHLCIEVSHGLHASDQAKRQLCCVIQLSYGRANNFSRAVVRLPNPKLKTLGERGIECIFVGYAEHSKAFRFSSVPEPSLRIPNGTEDISGSVVPEEVTEEVVTQQPEPELRKAINDERTHHGQQNWVLADLPPGFKPLGYKWIFKRKLKVDGTIEMFKARLVIQGFKQKSGIDYFDTYALVARTSTIRMPIAIASIHNLVIHQMDVKTAFLNGDLEEEVYINQPQGFIMPGNENKAVSQLEYFRVIDCLMYAMICTRPAIAFAVVLEGYIDASWICNIEDNSSTSGWVFLLGGGAIYWAFKK
ncbi:zinc finger, CCHC-type containing protein [Tanacetum coccineum]